MLIVVLPAWVPPVAFVRSRLLDEDARAERLVAARKADLDIHFTPDWLECPLLAARLIAAIRGPLFMRDAALSLTHLLAFDFSNTDDGLWEIWRPVPLDGAHVTPSKPALARGICP